MESYLKEQNMNTIWIIKRIDEADFGCEERLPGEPLMTLVTLESDEGDNIQLEVADNWLIAMGLDEGDEWPEELVEQTKKEEDSILKQAEWMENYLDAASEIE